MKTNGLALSDGVRAKSGTAQPSASNAEAALLAQERDVCSYGDTVHYADRPKLFTRCLGSFLYDSQDRPYLDLQMLHSSVNLGYGFPRMIDAVKRQLDTLPHLASQYLHREKIELASRIVEETEKRFGVKGRVHFNVGGAQAIEDALKLVRKYTGRQRMLAFEGGYHGRTLGASSISASYRYREPFGEFGDRAEFLPYPYCARCPFGEPRDREWCCQQGPRQVARKFDHECTGWWNPKTGHAEFGALFLEPVQGTGGGYVIPPKDYFPRVAEICRAHGILIVDDEVKVGFYRTGKLWAIEHFDVVPDVIVFGKSLTNGLNPLSGIWAREGLINPEQFEPGMTHSTFASNPLGTAAGLEMMKIFAEENYEPRVQAQGAYLLGLLRELKAKHPAIAHVDGLGLALRIELCQPDGVTPNRELAHRILERGLDGHLRIHGQPGGLVLEGSGYDKHVITLAPSLHITEDEMNLAYELLDTLLTECTREG